MADTPGLVAWEDLKVGETYWGLVPGWRWLPTQYTFVEQLHGNLGDQVFKDVCGSWIDKDDFADAHGAPETTIPMIFATCADACDAMIERLQAFKEEQEANRG